MKNKRFIFQGITSDNHCTAILDLLRIPKSTEIIISTAFMTEEGLLQLGDVLSTASPKPIIFAGIRNGITSAQALHKSLAIGCETYAVDTGSRHVIFHPKIYLARNKNEAHIIIGSANLTRGGLSNNIEASMYFDLNLSDKKDLGLFKHVRLSLLELRSDQHKDNVFIVDEKKVNDLLKSGLVIDEDLKRPATPIGLSKSRDLDDTPPMALKTYPLKPKKSSKRVKSTGRKTKTSVTKRTKNQLLWKSSPLTERYLTIPKGANTHQTGSMLFTKGQLEDIDQRHYFRNEVFADLNWQPDQSLQKAHLETAEARFLIIIKGVEYDISTLTITHNTKTDSKAYKQKNSMTGLRWGVARNLIARKDLLKKTMYLYRDNKENDLFVLEID